MHSVPLVDAEHIQFKSFTWISSTNPHNSVNNEILSLAPIFTEKEQKYLRLNSLNNTTSKLMNSI